MNLSLRQPFPSNGIQLANGVPAGAQLLSSARGIEAGRKSKSGHSNPRTSRESHSTRRYDGSFTAPSPSLPTEQLDVSDARQSPFPPTPLKPSEDIHHTQSRHCTGPDESLQGVTSNLLWSFLTISSCDNHNESRSTCPSFERAPRKINSSRGLRKSATSRKSQDRMGGTRLADLAQSSCKSKAPYGDNVADRSRYPAVPFYLSNIYPPSCNPQFNNIDPTGDFAEWCDGSSATIKVSLWVRSVSGTLQASRKGKERERFPADAWSLLMDWSVNLNEMQPLLFPVCFYFSIYSILLVTHSPRSCRKTQSYYPITH